MVSWALYPGTGQSDRCGGVGAGGVVGSGWSSKKTGSTVELLSDILKNTVSTGEVSDKADLTAGKKHIMYTQMFPH